MSSIHLLKEYKGKKPGTVITVPYLAGRELVKTGIGEPWNGGTPASKAASVAPAEAPEFSVEDYKAAVDRIRKLEGLCQELDEEIEELKRENGELKELMKADAPPTQPPVNPPAQPPSADPAATTDKPKKPAK